MNAPADPATNPADPVKPLPFARLFEFGYEAAEHQSYDASYVDEAEGPIRLVFTLIRLQDDRGREPGFCYLAIEGFPHLGRVLSKPYAQAARDLHDEVVLSFGRAQRAGAAPLHPVVQGFRPSNPSTPEAA